MSFLAPRIFLISAVLVILPETLLGHSPHHIITDVAVSPAIGSKNEVFILITDQIFRSDENGSSWKNLVNGLNNQYAFTSLSISPDYESDNTLFVASAGDGVFRSTNNGDSWRRVNTGMGSLDTFELSISKNFENDRRLLAAAKSGGVWRSDDSADNWERVLAEDVQIVQIAEILGANEQTVVVAGDSSGRVYRSEDSGRSWEIIFEFPGDITISSVAGRADELYVGTEENGLYLSTDSGQTFDRVRQLQVFRRKNCQGNNFEQSLPDLHVTSINLLPDSWNSNTVFVTTWYNGVFVSDDKGESWSSWREGLSCDRQADDMEVAHFRDVAISTRENGESVFWLGAFDGLFRSVGEYREWHRLETLPLGLIKGMALTRGARNSLVIALGTYGGGFYLSEDRGKSWTIGNKGLPTTRLTDLLFSADYNEDGVIYAGASGRLLKSSDRGHSWRRFNLRKVGFGTRVLNKLDSWGMPTTWLRSSDSQGLPRIYPTHIVALPGSDAGSVLIATRSHGLMGFDENSESVESVWAGTDRIMNSLAISPDFERDHTLLSSIRGEGLVRSEDGGIRWVAINNGLEFVKDWAHSPESGGFKRDVFVAISPDFRIDHTLFAGSPAGDGLYVSHDRGNSWRRVTMGMETFPAPVLAIAVSPGFRTNKTLLVSIKGHGLLRSVDQGHHFETVGEQLIAANASIELLEFSPDYLNDQSIVAVSDEKLFISEDLGISWSEVQRPVRYEDMRDVVLFTGDWERHTGENYSAMTETVTSGVGDGARLQFVGGGIRWLGSRGPKYGSAEVYVDDQLVDTVRCHSNKLENMQELFIAQELEFGAHMIEVRLVSEQIEDRSAVISIDAFDVLPARITVH